MAHLKVKHSPAPTVEQLTCPISSKVFKVIKTMRELFWAVLTPKRSEQAHGGERQMLSKEGVAGNMY